MITQTEGVIILVCFYVLAWIWLRNTDNIRAAWWRWKCSRGKHRLYETVANYATGWPSTGYACYECNRKWDWDGNEKPNNDTGH